MSTSVVRQREHVGRRRHLDDQRRERGDGADAGEADRGDIEEVAAANAVAVASNLWLPEPQRIVPWWPSFPFVTLVAFGAGIGTLATPRRTGTSERDWRA